MRTPSSAVLVLVLAACLAGAAVPARAADREPVFWQSIQGSDNPADYRAYLDQFPDGTFARLARNRLAEMKGAARRPDPVFADTNPDFVFPDSSRRYLSRADLRGLSAVELRIARNEIFARNGYVFDSQDLDAYFRQMDWYRPRTRNVTLNAVEQANVDLIKSYER